MPELEIVRHSASHVMAQAVQHLFPEARFGIGPAIENGFYYDMELSRPLTPEDLEWIEGEMRKIIEADRPFVTSSMNSEEALRFFQERNPDIGLSTLPFDHLAATFATDAAAT